MLKQQTLYKYDHYYKAFSKNPYCSPTFFETSINFMLKLIIGCNNHEQSMDNSIGPVYDLSQSASGEWQKLRLPTSMVVDI